MENKKLSGDFLLIEGYAQWESDEEWEENRCDDELPTAILAIKEWFLQKFAEDSGYGSLDEFFGDYTWETIDSLQAFCFCLSADTGTTLPVPGGDDCGNGAGSGGVHGI